MERSRLGDAKVAFAVADAETGEFLETMNPFLPQPPASTAKAITALYALDSLGADHRFSTRVVGTGPVEDGLLKGDLVLVGSGDPTLDTNRLATLAANLKAAGVHSVEGKFLTWDGALPIVHAIDADQPVQVGYNPAISGLNLNFNRVHFEWRRAGSGWNTTMDARSDKYRPDVTVSRMSIVKRRYPIYTYEDGGEVDRWTVASGALGGDGARWLPVRKPTAYTAEVFQILARSHGIDLDAAGSAPEKPDGTVLAEVESTELRSMVKAMLKYSTNITAEAVGLASSAARAGGVPEPLPISAGRMSAWLGARVDSSRVALLDHSGLGGASRITAPDMTRAMVRLGPAAGLEPLLKPFYIRDSQGRSDRNHPVKVNAKTGTLNFVNALTGYINPPGGRKLAFAIFISDVPRRDALTVAQRERPEGGRTFANRARRLQSRLIERWSEVHAA
ncbi:D-alanyl-D-alanine carboxypeptidase/D-alanyl-D-alanine endopeptidase [Aliiruegeria haliotis]|uniref:D-alanyl-D-alanine carboxypeptidase/D-alanyl-D-alanine endopeptidase n=1 Tax=Aliiruegeria haliotis TaxID=1280846 RepID=UPI0031844843